MATLFYLMGPTAAGKTPLAIALAQRFPFEIISVDSVMIYRGLDIGSAKPSAAELALAPHRLIDIKEPHEVYSAGQFREEALIEIDKIIARGKVPLLVGGTMLYFRVLQQGIADLPSADEHLRKTLQQEADHLGWPHMHARLALLDPAAAARIHVHDSQRIQRALEVHILTGEPITVCQQKATQALSPHLIHPLVIAPSLRSALHARIAARLAAMFAQGFIAEVEKLYARPELHTDLPALRSVGYKQVWDYLAGEGSEAEMREKALAATRQLAKRQLTWLRPWPHATWFDSDDADLLEKVSRMVGKILG